MNKKIAFLIVLLVVALLAAFFFVSNAEAGIYQLKRGQPYRFDELMTFYDLFDPNCGKVDFPLCETIGHMGLPYVDKLGYTRIPGMFLASDSYWYVTHPADVFEKAGNNCYPYETVAFHQSGACMGSYFDNGNSICPDYIGRPGFVYNWHSQDNWPEGVIPNVSGYYVAGIPDEVLYCKIQN